MADIIFLVLFIWVICGGLFLIFHYSVISDRKIDDLPPSVFFTTFLLWPLLAFVDALKILGSIVFNLPKIVFAIGRGTGRGTKKVGSSIGTGLSGFTQELFR